nr:unnamed protein product [Fasciola hepatica]
MQSSPGTADVHQIELHENRGHRESENVIQLVTKRPVSGNLTTAKVYPISDNTDPIDLEPEGHGFCGYFLIALAVLMYIFLFPILVLFSFKVIQSYERGVMLRLGKLRKHKGSAIMSSGIQFVLPCVDTIQKVDMRTISEVIPPQEVLTRDSVTVTVDAIVYMRVIEPASAILRVANWLQSTGLLAVSTLRSVLGHYDLAALLTNREEIDTYLKKSLEAATREWGIKVERVEIKDVALPQDMQRAMAAEAQATRAACAKVIAAKGELDSAHMLQQAAQTMSGSPAALQLRYLQTLATIATEQNSTIIFPLPIELMSALTSRNK